MIVKTDDIRVSLYLLIGLAILGGAPCFGAPRPDLEEHVYKTVGDKALRLFIVKPPNWKATDKHPALVNFHGGGWYAGLPSTHDDRSRYLASRGMVCVDVEYRLLERSSKEPPLVCVQDAKSAMRWVRSHAADLGVDPDRIGASGGSAGSHLAACVGMIEGLDDPADDLKVSAKANALLLYKPIIDIAKDHGFGRQRMEGRYQEFSPAANITPDDPPTLLVAGTMDRAAPAEYVNTFSEALKEAGVRSEVLLLEGAEHNFQYNMAQAGTYYDALLVTDRFLASLGWLEGDPTVVKPADSLPAASTGGDEQTREDP
jgi:acetyl esterase